MDVINAVDLEVDMRYWCWWMSRYLWYRGRIGQKREYLFEDAVGVCVVLDEKRIKRLRLHKSPK